jgi:polysaccharide biosynthesis acetyltransferase WcbI-like protein
MPCDALAIGCVCSRGGSHHGDARFARGRAKVFEERALREIKYALGLLMSEQSHSNDASRSGACRAIEKVDSFSLVVGFVGNCQAELLHQVFQRAALGRGITAFYHFVDLSKVQLVQSREEISTCDVLFLQDIQDVEHYPLRDSIPKRTQVINFPFIRFAAPWPYDDFNGIRDGIARAQDDPALHSVTYYDGMLSRLRRRIPNSRERLETYRKLDIPDAINPLRVLDFEARRLEALDKRFGISIGRFILNEFRKRQLFYTVNRPCGTVLELVMDYILKFLDLDLNITSSKNLDELRQIQVPVHPMVARRLDIEWANETTIYETNGQRVMWEDYVRQYIERYG